VSATNAINSAARRRNVFENVIAKIRVA